VDLERVILSKVINDRCWANLIDGGISRIHFVDEEHLRVYDLLSDHFAKHGTSMSRDAFKMNYPSYKLPEAAEPIEYYVEQMHERRRYTLMQLMVADASDALDDDAPDEAERILTVGVSDLSIEHIGLLDHDLTEDWEERLDTYDLWQSDPGALRGITTGFESVDNTTRGLPNGNFVVIVGPPGVGKTTLLLAMARNVHGDGNKVLAVSFEMSYEELAARHDAQVAKIDHHKLLAGQLSDDEMDHLEKRLARNSEKESFIISEDIQQATTVSGLRVAIQRHRPRVVFVDGVYMMQDEGGESPGSEAALRNISRGLKRLALSEKIPIVVTMQALLSKMRGNRLTLNSIGYTSAFGQDGNVVLGLTMDEEDRGLANLETLKSRNGPIVTAQLDWDWKTSRFEELESDWSNDEVRA
jgi:archaellum biogenesis ATPase FlaH